ncbi:Ig-like domain-containing protein, partial [Aequorivita echinoideorum]
MKKVTLLIFLTFFPFIFYGQQCPDPIANDVQYFCTGSVQTLNNLTVTASGTLTWYSDPAGTNVIPGTTTIISGTTYYVSNTDTLAGCTESNLVPITVYLQSLHFNVNPQSCIDLGNNVFLVDPNGPIQIDVLDINNNPKTARWTPVGNPLYIDAALTLSHFAFPTGFSTLYFGNAVADREYVYTVSTLPTQIAAGVCPRGTQQFTLLTGSFIYDDLCYNTTTTLAGLGVPGGNITWYSDAGGTTIIPETTVVVGGQTYYAGFNDPSCPDILPVIVEYAVDAPIGDSNALFCTAATWLSVGITEDDDRLSDLNICGTNLTFYDATGTTPIPANTPLTDGTTYQVTQTVSGCESEPLVIMATERVCSCIKNETGFTFNRRVITSGNLHDSCNENNITGPATIGAPNVFTSAAVVPSTPGNDPNLAAAGIPNHPRTSPFVACTNNAYRINNTETGFGSGSELVAMKKQFIAGEVMTFDFSMILQNPSGHVKEDQPFLKINIFDENNNLFSERCVTSDPGNCIFRSTTFNGQPLVYTDWSCLKVNTIELQGQRVTAEIILGDCNLSGHWAYAYVDNFQVGDDGPNVCSNSSFGYLALNSTTAVTGEDYRACSLIDNPAPAECDPLAPVLNPLFPFDVCGDLTAPVSATGNGISPGPLQMNIFQNGNNVGNSTAIQPSGGGSGFCFEIDQSDITVPLFGYFSFQATAEYQINCGTAINYDLDADLNGFKVCPVAECPTPLTVCGTTSTGFATFDLTSRESEIISRYPGPAAPFGNLIVTFYETLLQAQNGGPQIATPTAYQNTTINTQTVFARLDFDWAGLGVAAPYPDDCYDIVPLELFAGIAPDVPAYPNITPLTQCPDPLTTSYTFNLNDVETELLANLAVPTDYTYVFYTSLNNAQLEQSPITNPLTYTVNVPPAISPIRIYVRVEGPDGCFTITSFDLIIFPDIVYTPPTDYELCDDQTTADGFTQFDLNSKVTEINSPGSTITFYDNQTSADTGVGTPLPLLYTNTINPETVYVRIEDANGCSITEEFDLIVNPNPIAGPVDDMARCGAGSAQFDFSIPGAQAINGQTDLSVSFYLTQANAEGGLPANQLPVLYTHSGGPTTIYIRLENDITGCFTIIPFMIEIVGAPPITSPITDYLLCDINQDGTEIFDLTSKENEILGTIPPNTVDITYHVSVADRNNGIAIATPNAFNSGGQTIYFRVTYNDGSGCFSDGQFVIGLEPAITFTTPTDYELCDDQTADGFTQFDLNTKVTEINTTGTVTFYNNPADATSGAGTTLPLLYTNTSNSQTIYVRIVSAGGCFTTTEFDLIVNPNPVAGTPTDLELCDSGNGSAQFDLSVPGAEIENGQAGVTTTFYLTQILAEGGTTGQLPTLYTASGGPTTIYTRLEDNATGCFTIATFTIEVIPAPAITSPITDYILCDNDQDGTEDFDLTSKEPEILNTINPATVTVSYYLSVADRNNGIAIATPNAFNSAGQTIYFRVTSNDPTACFSDGQFVIGLEPAIAFTTPTDYELCDDQTADGFTQFDLNTKVTEINTTGTVTFYDNPADATSGAGTTLPLLYTNTSNSQTIYVRIVSAGGCFTTTEFDLIVNPNPVAGTPTDLELCDSGNGSAQFDLSVPGAEIENGQAGVTTTFYLTQILAEGGTTGQLPTLYTASGGPTTIYTRLEDNATGCFTIATFTIEVIPAPAITSPITDYILCDNDQDGTEDFDLTSKEPEILNTINPATVTVSYYLSVADRNNG